MKQIKHAVYEQARILGPKIAFLAVFGVTGAVCLGAVTAFRAIKSVKNADFEITEDDWKNGQA